MALKAGRPTGRTVEHISDSSARLEGYRRLNMNLPISEYRRLKMYAAEHDKTVTEIVREALNKYLNK